MGVGSHELDDSERRKLKLAPLVHKWFARRRPEAVAAAFQLLESRSPKRRLTILDPFCGSGSLLLEAKRRGHRFIGVDVNPVAALIADYTLDPPKGDDVLDALTTLEEVVGGAIKDVYRRSAGRTPEDYVTLFHSREVQCHCGKSIELHHSWLIARSKFRKWAAYLCPGCRTVFNAGIKNPIRCTGCDLEFDWSIGTISTNVVSCSGCGEKSPLLSLPGVSDQPSHRLVAIETVSDGKRVFSKPSDDEVRCLMRPPASLNGASAEAISDVMIPVDDRFDPRPVSHGFKSYGDLFTSRQMIALSAIAKAVRRVDDGRLRGAFALMLSDAAGSNNLLCRYAADYLKLTPAFGMHAYHPVARPVEGNVWGAEFGRGSFKNCVKKATRAFESLGQIGDGEGEILLGDATSLSKIDDNSVDAIFTDPPYFDFIDYANLSDFYYQWLKTCLPDHEWFSAEHARSPNDISMMRADDRGSFSRGLAAAFAECVRVVRPGGPIVFSYHHSKARGWLELLTAMRVAGLVVESVHMVSSELNNGFHSHPGNIKSDAIFVCFERSWAHRQAPLPVATIGSCESDTKMMLFATAVAELSWSDEPVCEDALRLVARRVVSTQQGAVSEDSPETHKAHLAGA